MPDSELNLLLKKWQGNTSNYPRNHCIHELFESYAEQFPDQIALEFDGVSLSYRELNVRANQLAHYLRKFGIKRESPVAIYLDRSLEMIIGLLGVMKAGGFYVPIDPKWPAKRISYVLSDIKADVLLTDNHNVEIPTDYPGEVILLNADNNDLNSAPTRKINNINTAEDLAYVMFTSGTTGQPKGVSITHRGVVRLVKNTNYIDIHSHDVFLQLAPLAFDASTFEIWAPLLNGARLVVATPGILSLAEIGSHLRRYQVSVLWLTAGLFHQMVDHNLSDLENLSYLLAGGDVLSPQHVKRVLNIIPKCQLINGYGPTENTTFTCCYHLRDANSIENRVPIGTPISNTEVYVLDQKLQPVPVGVTGELYIGGDGLARGYWGKPELTNERFVTLTLGSKSAKRLYSSGDLVRWHKDGYLQFLGRNDDQVKIRGYRIEPAETESSLRRHPSVLDASVQVRVDSNSNKYLEAYLVVKDGQQLTPREVHVFLSDQLPYYMIPSNFSFIDKIPLTVNGKIDRQKLLKLPKSLNVVIAGPRSKRETEIYQLWEEILEVQHLDIHRTFLELGGDSLRAIQLAARLKEAYQVDLQLSQLILNGTIADQAVAIEKATTDRTKSLQQGPSTIPRNQFIPLSKSQQRLWFLHQYNPLNQAYTIALGYRLKGALDVSALESSIREIINRHEILRTTFVTVDGKSHQKIGLLDTFCLEQLDIYDTPLEERSEHVVNILGKIAQQPFDLENGPLTKAALVSVGADEHVLLLKVHHMVFDGKSEELFFQELSEIYKYKTTGKTSQLATLEIQYADFAAWERQPRPAKHLKEERDYWGNKLRDAPSLLKLPTDHPRPLSQASVGRTLFCNLPRSLGEKLKQFSKKQDTTLFVTLLTAYYVLLKQITGQHDLVVGTAVTQRDRAELEPLIGFFVNTIALRNDLSDNPVFSDLLKRTQSVVFEALDHQQIPFEQVIQELNIVRNASYPPLVQVAFVLHDVKVNFPNITVERVPVDPGTAKFDLTLIAVNNPEGIQLWVEYNTNLFKNDTVQGWLVQYQKILEEIVLEPDLLIEQFEDSRNAIPPIVTTSEIRASSEVPAGIHIDAELESKLKCIWEQILNVENISNNDDFFTLGGHSLLVLELAAMIESSFGKSLTISQLFEHKTILDQTRLILNSVEHNRHPSIIQICNGTGVPLILLPNIEGLAFASEWVIRHSPSNKKIVAVDISGINELEQLASIESIAGTCINILDQAGIKEPYQLLGYSFGGNLAYETARQLANRGHKVQFVGMIDSGVLSQIRKPWSDKILDVRYFISNLPLWFLNVLRNRRMKKEIMRLIDACTKPIQKLLKVNFNERHKKPWWVQGTSVTNLRKLVLHTELLVDYKPQPYDGTVHLFRAKIRMLFHHFTPDAGWKYIPIDNLKIHHIPGDHVSMTKEPHCEQLGQKVFKVIKHGNEANKK